jgi:hypothetical protein
VSFPYIVVRCGACVLLYKWGAGWYRLSAIRLLFRDPDFDRFWVTEQNYTGIANHCPGEKLSGAWNLQEGLGWQNLPAKLTKNARRGLDRQHNRPAKWYNGARSDEHS